MSAQTTLCDDSGELTFCPECGKSFDHTAGMKIHYGRSHPERKTGKFYPWNDIDPVECPSCGQICDSEAGMRRHHYRKHDESLARVTRVCRDCGEETEMYESQLKQLSFQDLCEECAYKVGFEHTEEAKQKMSKAVQESDYDYPDEHMEKCWEGYREWYENGGKEEMQKWAKERDPPELTEETRQQISETLMGHEVSEETRQKIRENGRPGYVKQIDVEETGHTVRSTWEEAIDRLLYYSQYDFEFEPERFDIGGQYYLPDFIVGDDVIEVKGWVTDHSIDRAERFMDQYPEYRYICVGSEGLPCDVHIEYEQRHELLDVL